MARKRNLADQSVWLSIKEVAAAIGMSVAYVETAKADGSLPHHKFGKAVRFHKDDVEAFIADARRVGHPALARGRKAGR